MRYHHTKNKGDFGLVQAMADLTAKGWAILVPLTEHEAFDLVACREGRFLRVQVKYRAMSRGCVTLHFRSIKPEQHPEGRYLGERLCPDPTDSPRSSGGFRPAT
ncbi:MAG TPA: group I intron-associated PD-(D/E)XK endonuclease [Kofleriaceae bacterium]|nr:group I intron-associated PD-(D/E)XK endonuclease [Kofleriaceae bacterium]